jgi:hypothetical protein
MTDSRGPERSDAQAPAATVGEILRAKAVSEGLPPLVALATQISTSVMGNIVAYRGSGPIPPGMYHHVLTGQARPKPVTEKAKSSTIGPQAGYAPLDQRNGRYEKTQDGYALRIEKDPPNPNLSSRVLETSIRNIFNDLGVKYELVNGKNPDENGLLRFYQSNHEYDKIKDIIYSINLNTAKAIDPDILKNYKLVSNHFENAGKEPLPGSPFHGLNLDALCDTYVQHPGESEPVPIKVLGDIVRDCDLDSITNPPHEAMVNMLGNEPREGYFKERFFTLIDMSAHHHAGDPEYNDMEDCRAELAVADMLKKMLEINSLRWNNYNYQKSTARLAAGSDFDEAKWELQNVEKKPFVHENINLDIMSAMVVTVGKGSPMQVYQGLEINVIEQKILASQTVALATKINLTDLDSPNVMTRNAALNALHQQDIPYNRETIAKSFIQHPAEMCNEHYTCPRGQVVAVSHDKINIGDDAMLANMVREKHQFQPINPKWIEESSLGSRNSKIWVEHYLSMDNNERKSVDAEVKAQVISFLTKPVNRDMARRSLSEGICKFDPELAAVKERLSVTDEKAESPRAVSRGHVWPANDGAPSLGSYISPRKGGSGLAPLPESPASTDPVIAPQTDTPKLR